MVHITLCIMEKMQFNYFPIISLWDLQLSQQPNQKADHHNFSYFYPAPPTSHPTHPQSNIPT